MMNIVVMVLKLHINQGSDIRETTRCKKLNQDEIYELETKKIK